MNDQQQNILFEVIDWEKISKEEHPGESGSSTWRIKEFGGLRIRLVKYEPGYLADHWCKKGHVLYCFEGEMQTELEDGRVMKLTAGTCYLVGDNDEAHRSSTPTGCKLFIVD